LTREETGLDQRVTPYSIRHRLARELRKRRVPMEQSSRLDNGEGGVPQGGHQHEACPEARDGDNVRAAWRVSIRRACRAVPVDRSTYH
jgi:hypothetical protein